MTRAVIVLLLAFLLVSARGDEAAAHAALVAAEPADGAVLEQPPPVVVLTFNEPVTPLVFSLLDPHGRATRLTDVHAQDRAVHVVAPTGGERGTHVLSWRVISADGHPVGGAIVFSVGDTTAGGEVTRAASAKLLAAAIWLARIALYLGLFAGVGGSFFEAWLSPRPIVSPPLVTAALGIGLVAAIVSVGLQGLDALALGYAALFDLDTWRAGMATSLGPSMLVAASAIVTAAGAHYLPRRAAARSVAVVALLGVGLAFAMSGHASSAAPTWLMRPAVFLHLIAVAIWLGSLWPLAKLVATDAKRGGMALACFSRLIPVVVLTLAAAGVILATVQVERIDALWRTTYGFLLSAKLLVFAALLGLSAYNRFWLTRPAVAGDSRHRRRLVRSIAAEAALVVLIGALTAQLRVTPPPRAALAGPERPAAQFHFHGQDAMAHAAVSPIGRDRGRYALTITIMSASHTPLAAKEVSLRLARDLPDMEPIERTASQQADGSWRCEVAVPAGGRWTAYVDVLVSDFLKITLEGPIAFD